MAFFISVLQRAAPPSRERGVALATGAAAVLASEPELGASELELLSYEIELASSDSEDNSADVKRCLRRRVRIPSRLSAAFDTTLPPTRTLMSSPETFMYDRRR